VQGITEETMHLYMQPSVDIISRGSLTQGTYACNFTAVPCTQSLIYACNDGGAYAGYACADYSLKIDVKKEEA
jgi:hypothetical protein